MGVCCLRVPLSGWFCNHYFGPRAEEAPVVLKGKLGQTTGGFWSPGHPTGQVLGLGTDGADGSTQMGGDLSEKVAAI